MTSLPWRVRKEVYKKNHRKKYFFFGDDEVKALYVVITSPPTTISVLCQIELQSELQTAKLCKKHDLTKQITSNEQSNCFATNMRASSFNLLQFGHLFLNHTVSFRDLDLR